MGQFFQGPDYGTAGNWNGKWQLKPPTLHHVGSQRTRPSEVTACGTLSCVPTFHPHVATDGSGALDTETSSFEELCFGLCQVKQLENRGWKYS